MSGAGLPAPGSGAVDLDAVNRGRWADGGVAAEFGRAGATSQLACWSDAGEQAALTAIAPRLRGARVLDLGIGGGRTTTLLRMLTDDYLGIDYTPEMVEQARRNHPDADLRLGDARSLSDVADGSVDVVVFSYNGLDAVDHDGRAQALGEIARVLRPGGLLQHSTLNKSGPNFRATPWRPAGAVDRDGWTPLYRAGMALARALHAPRTLPRSVANYRRLSAAAVDHGSWALGPLEAHEFSLMVHYTTLAGARAELDAVGLDLELAFDAEHGQRLPLDADPREVRYLQLVSRKR